jgi:Asp-tRNA(Asn)/Glu-tRNA(Gln) amidotransferase A subunit family amidase
LLHGVPVLVKDNIETAGIKTTYGSGFFRDHVPSSDATVIKRLRNAGATSWVKLRGMNLHLVDRPG